MPSPRRSPAAVTARPWPPASPARSRGLGNVISGLTITGSSNNAGVIGTLNSGGLVRDVGLVGDGVSGGSDVAGLVGKNRGTVATSYTTGTVSGASEVGGLVGSNYGTVATSFATGAVSGGSSVGGLVGGSSGGIVSSSATGSVTGTSGWVGGLVGVSAGLIESSYATGAVSGASYDVGGLTGSNAGGTVETSYATGAVSGATYVGGLVGFNANLVETSYATGRVSAGSDFGGLVGHQGASGSVVDSYWDTATTGQATSAGSAASYGLTTGQLQSNYNGFVSKLNSGGTAFGGGTGGLYPYLLNFFPNGVQAVSGFAYSDAGSTPLASGAGGAITVGVIANKVSLGTATTGANGYYYIATAAGNVPSGQSVLAYGNTPNAATLVTSAGAANTGVNLHGDALAGTTSDTSYLQAITDLSIALTAAAGGNSQALSAVEHANGLYLTATGSSFTLDAAATAYAADSMLVIQTTATNAPISIDKPITIEGTNQLVLDASGALIVNAPISITGGGQVTLDFNTASTAAPGGLSFDLGAGGFGGSLSYAANAGTGEGIAGQSLTINGTPYTLLYSMSDVAGMASSGAYALAKPISGAGYGAAVVASFSGTLEGLGNSIAGLTINASSNDVGLIGQLEGGGLVRDVGIAGGAVSGADNVGGLVGANYGTVETSYATDTASGGFAVGGLVGGVNPSGLVAASYASGNVTGSYYAGGLVGANFGTVETSYASGAVLASGHFAGGLVGSNGATVETSFATGRVSGSAYVGGLVGHNGVSATVEASYATGAVFGNDYVGGLVGRNDTRATVETSYATGAVTGGYAVGGLLGLNEGGSVSTSYWDVDTTNQSGTETGAIGLTTAQLQGTAALPNGVTFSLGAAFAGGAASPGANPTLSTQPGFYPYLLNFFPSGVQAISGNAPAGGTVTVDVAGQTFGAGGVSVGANGYYYQAAAAGTIAAGGSAVIAYSSGVNGGARLETLTGTTTASTSCPRP
jgi:hypothetical protein